MIVPLTFSTIVIILLIPVFWVLWKIFWPTILIGLMLILLGAGSAHWFEPVINTIAIINLILAIVKGIIKIINSFVNKL